VNVNKPCAVTLASVVPLHWQFIGQIWASNLPFILPAFREFAAASCGVILGKHVFLIPVLCSVLANAFTPLSTERLLQARQLCALQPLQTRCLLAPSPCYCDQL
jgi:hypothetical protein